MKLNEEKDIILKWVYSVRKAMEPKKKEIKTEKKEDKMVDKDGRPYHLNGYKHKVYEENYR